MQRNVSNEWMRICNIFSDTELVRAKNTLKANWLRRTESEYFFNLRLFSDKISSSHSIVHYLISESVNNNQDIANEVLIHGNRIPFDELSRKIDDITAEKVRQVLSHYVYDRHPVVSAVGQHENLTDLNRITETLFWWRT